MKTHRTIVIVLVLFLCVASAAFAVYADFVINTDIPNQPQAESTESAAADDQDVLESKENATGQPVQKFEDNHGKTQDSTLSPAPTNTEQQIVEPSSTHVPTTSPSQESPAATDSPTLTESSSIPTESPSSGESNQDDTSSVGGMHLKIIKVSGNEENIVADFVGWEFVVVVIFWLIITMLLFVFSLFLVNRYLWSKREKERIMDKFSGRSKMD